MKQKRGVMLTILVAIQRLLVWLLKRVTWLWYKLSGIATDEDIRVIMDDLDQDLKDDLDL